MLSYTIAAAAGDIAPHGLDRLSYRFRAASDRCALSCVNVLMRGA